MIAFHYPPLSAAGTHRSLNFSRILAQRGYRIGVVTAASHAGMATDEGLLARVPTSVTVVRAGHVDPFRVLQRLRGGAVPPMRNGTAPSGVMPGPGEISSVPRGRLAAALDYVSRCVTLPDRYATWVPGAVAAAVVLARRIDARVIYSTAPPYSAHLVGLLASNVLALPWIVDLRDPWTMNPFHENPYPSLRRADEALEEKVVRRASRVILNTEQAEARYRAHFPELDKFSTITNGIDPELLARDVPPYHANGRLTLLHVGGIYGRRFPRGLLAALALLARRDRSLYDKLCIEQIGHGLENRRLVALAEELGVADRVRVGVAVEHAEAFRRCTAADGLLLLGPAGEEPEVQVPSKLYEYAAARRPVLALAQRDGAIAAILVRSGVPHVLAAPDDPEDIVRGIRRFANGEFVGTSTADALKNLGYQHLTTRLADEIDAALAGGRPRGPEEETHDA